MTPREDLARAIAAKAAADTKLAEAEAAVTGARRFVDMLEAKLQRFADLDAKVASERAALVKEAVAKGGVPRFDPSPELAAAMGERVETEASLTAARSAQAELDREATQHRGAAAALDVQVGIEAERVVIEETERIASEIDDLEARALGLRASLDGAHMHHFQRGGRPVPIRVADQVQRIIQTTDIKTNSPLHHRARRSRDAWAGFIAALKVDAAAEFKEGEHGDE